MARRADPTYPQEGDREPAAEPSAEPSGEPSSEPTEWVGRYAVCATLGTGGMGEVLRVHDPALGRDVALKRMLHPDPSPAARARFEDEAVVTAALSHPGVVAVHEIGDDGGRPFFTMAEVRGRTLADARDEGRSQNDLLDDFVRVCETIAYAHSRGVVHRDLKPSNVMIGGFGEVLVMDWGIARARPSSDPSEVVGDDVRTTGGTKLGAALGTPGFMSPEQWAGAWDLLDARSDVWALGAMLAALLCGAPEAAVTHGGLDGIAPELRSIVLRATAPRREDRYPDALALAADVRAARTGGWVAAHRYGRWERVGRAVARYGAPLAAGTAVLALLTLGVAVALVGVDRARQRAERAELALQRSLVAALADGAARAWQDDTPADAAVLAAAALAHGEDAAMRGHVVAARTRSTPSRIAAIPLDERCMDLVPSPGGDRVACAGSGSGAGQTRVFLVSETGLEPVFAVSGYLPVTWSTDGSALAVSRYDGVVVVDAAGIEVAHHDPCGHLPSALASDPGGGWLAGCATGVVRVDRAGTTPVDPLPHATAIQPVPDGMLVAGPTAARVVGGPERPEWAGVGGLAFHAGAAVERYRDSGSATGRLWSPSGELRRLFGHGDEITGAAFLDGTVATASLDGSIRWWSAQDGAPLGRFVLHDGGISAMNALLDGRWLTATRTPEGGGRERGTLTLWAAGLAPWTPLMTTTPDETLFALRRCGSRWFAGGSGGRVYDLADGPSVGIGAPIVEFGCADDVPWVWTTSGRLEHTPDGWVNREVPSTALRFGGIGAGLQAVISHDGRLWVAVGTGWRDAGLTGQAWLAVEPEGRWVASFAEDGAVAIVDASGGVVAFPESPPFTPGIPAVSADGRWLSVGSKGGGVWLWETDGFEVALRLGATNWAREVAFSPDGTRIAASFNDGTARVWDRASGSLLVDVPPLGGRARRAAWWDDALWVVVDDHVVGLDLGLLAAAPDTIRRETAARWGLDALHGGLQGGVQ